MKNATIKTNTTMVGLRFLLASEDSSATHAEGCPSCGTTCWNWAKTLLWLVFSVLTALLVGQL